MPYKDYSKKLDHSHKYRHSRSDQYHKWLYERRKLKMDKAARYEKTLRTISEMVTPEYMRAEAEEALEWAWKREREVGNRFDHEKDAPYWKD